jgi:O-antigen ligase
MGPSIREVNDAQLSRARFTGAFWQRQLGVIFSFETSLVLFLFAGIYKEDPRFSWIPGDLTILAFGISLLTGLLIIVRRGLILRRENIMICGLALLLILWAMLSYLWSPSLSYSIRKVGLLGSLTFWPLAAFALIVSTDRERVRRFFLVLLLFSLWVAIETGVSLVLAARSGVRGFITTSLSATYLGLGRVLGPGLLILVSYQIYFLRGAWQKLIGAGMVLLYTFLMLGLGSRGPFVAMFISALLIVAVNFRLGRNIRQITAQLVGLIAVICILIGTTFFFASTGMELPRTLQRLQEAREQGFEGSTRFEGYDTTWRMLEEAPVFGRGIGSWPVLTGRGDIRAYPHNIFLEVFFELGLIGLLLFVGLLLYAWSLIPPVRVLRREPWMMLAVAQLLSAFLNANISGDLNDNKLFWAFLGLVVVCALRSVPQDLDAPQTGQAAQPSSSS